MKFFKLIVAIKLCLSVAVFGSDKRLENEAHSSFVELADQSDVIVLVAEFRKNLIPPDSSVGTKGVVKIEAKVVSVIKGEIKINDNLSYQFLIEEWPKWIGVLSVPIESNLYLLSFDMNTVDSSKDVIELGDAVTRRTYEALLLESLQAHVKAP